MTATNDPYKAINFAGEWLAEEEESTHAGSAQTKSYTTGILEQGKQEHSFDLTITTIYEEELFTSLRELLENKEFSIQGLQWTTSYDGVVMITGSSTKQLDYASQTIKVQMRGPYNKLRIDAESKRIPLVHDFTPSAVDIYHRYQHGLYDDITTFSSIPAHWEQLYGTWSTTGGELYVSSAVGSSNHIRTTPYYLSAFVLSVKFKVGAVSGHSGIIFRLQSSYKAQSDSTKMANYYFYLEDSVPKVELSRYDNGPTGTVLWRKVLSSFDEATYYTLTVIAAGDTFYLYLDGEYLTKVIDSPYATGAVGIRLGNTSSRVSDYKCDILRDNPLVNLPNWQWNNRRHDIKGWKDTARGLINKMVYVKDSVDTIPWLERLGDEDVRVWDTNENRWRDDRGFFFKPLYWTRVYDPNHKFKGDIVIENGITAFIQTSGPSITALYPQVFRFRSVYKSSMTHGGVESRVVNPRLRMLDSLPEGIGKSPWRGDHVDMNNVSKHWADQYSGNTTPAFYKSAVWETRDGTSILTGNLPYRGYKGVNMYGGSEVYVNYRGWYPRFGKWRTVPQSSMVPISCSDDFQNDGFMVYGSANSTGIQIIQIFGNDSSYANTWSTGEYIPHESWNNLSHMMSGHREFVYLNGEMKAIRTRIDDDDWYIHGALRDIHIGAFGIGTPYMLSPFTGKLSEIEYGLRNKGRTMLKLNPSSTGNRAICWITCDLFDYDNTNNWLTDKSGLNTYHMRMNLTNQAHITPGGWYNDWLRSTQWTTKYSFGWIDALETPIGTAWTIGITFRYESTPTAGNSYRLFSYDSAGTDTVIIQISDANTLSVNINSSGYGSIAIATGNVYRVVVTWNNGDMDLYINGGFDSNSSTGTPTFVANVNAYIGGNGTSNTRTLNGYIDEITIYDDIVHPDEEGVVLYDQYKQGEIYPKSEFRYLDNQWKKRVNPKSPLYWFRQHSDTGHSTILDCHGTRHIENDTYSVKAGFKFPGVYGDFMWAWKNQGSIQFNHDEELEFPTIFTLQFNLYIFGLPAAHMLPFELFNNSFLTIVYCRIYSDGDIEFAMVGSGGVSRYMITTTTPLAVDTLYNISFRCDVPNDTGKILINGTEYTLTKSGTAQTTMRSIRYLIIGRNHATEFCNGAVGNITIYDSWLKDDELGFFVGESGPYAAAYGKHQGSGALTTPHFNTLELSEIRPDRVVGRLKEGKYGSSYEMKFRGDIGSISFRDYQRYHYKNDPSKDFFYFHWLKDDSVYDMDTYNPIKSEFGDCRFKINIYANKNIGNSHALEISRVIDSRRASSVGTYPIGSTLNHAEVINCIVVSPYNNVIWVNVHNQMSDEVDSTADYSTSGGTKNHFTDSHIFWIERGDYDDGTMEVGFIPVPYHNKMYFGINDADAWNASRLPGNIYFALPDQIAASVSLNPSSTQDPYAEYQNIYLDGGTYLLLYSDQLEAGADGIGAIVYSGGVIISRATYAPGYTNWTRNRECIFTVPEEGATDIRIRLIKTANSTGSHFDYFMIIPLSNGYNYPMDIIQQYMSETKVTKQIVKDID